MLYSRRAVLDVPGPSPPAAAPPVELLPASAAWAQPRRQRGQGLCSVAAGVTPPYGRFRTSWPFPSRLQHDLLNSCPSPLPFQRPVSPHPLPFEAKAARVQMSLADVAVFFWFFSPSGSGGTSSISVPRWGWRPQTALTAGWKWGEVTAKSTRLLFKAGRPQVPIHGRYGRQPRCNSALGDADGTEDSWRTVAPSWLGVADSAFKSPVKDGEST